MSTMATPRERTEEIERQTLAPRATLAEGSKGRDRDEPHRGHRAQPAPCRDDQAQDVGPAESPRRLRVARFGVVDGVEGDGAQ